LPGNDRDYDSDDMAQLIEALDPDNVAIIGFSTRRADHQPHPSGRCCRRNAIGP
jgi:hypothetical protein